MYFLINLVQDASYYSDQLHRIIRAGVYSGSIKIRHLGTVPDNCTDLFSVPLLPTFAYWWQWVAHTEFHLIYFGI
jgi:hypothetical protein